jgi:GNAT superfamily N-acetyltransferase
VAHRHAGGRWLATGGGGYDAYRVVPRAWSLVWLAGAHREPPAATDAGWRERWSAEAQRYGQAPLPATFDDPPNAGLVLDAAQLAAEERSGATVELVRRLTVPRLIREATDHRWWRPAEPVASSSPTSVADAKATPTILPRVEPDVWARLSLAPRTIAPLDPAIGHAIVLEAIREGAGVTAAVVDTTVVGLAVTRRADDASRSDLLALGVAPGFRRCGLATRLLATRVEWVRPTDVDHEAVITVAERDPIEPLDVAMRVAIARRLLAGAGYDVAAGGGAVGAADPSAVRGTRRAIDIE